MTIRTRITLVTVLVILLVACVLIVTGHISQQAAEDRYTQASLSGKRVLLEQIVARHASEMAAFTKAMTRDRVTLNALRAGDHKTLQEQADTTHNLFANDGTLERLQIVDSQGAYLASVPQSFSGTTRKGLALETAKEGKLMHGLARDDDGVLQMAISFPLYARGKLKGVVVYSRNIQRIIDDFQQSETSDVFVLGGDGSILAAAKENTMEQPAVPQLGTKGGMEVVQRDGSYRVVAALPMRNHSGETIATLLTSQDQTETYSLQATAMYTSFTIAVLALLGAAGGLFWYFKRMFRPIDQVIETMTEIADGNLTCTVQGRDADDETGRLSRGLCTMVKHLRRFVSDIAEATDRLSSAAGELTGIAGQGTETISRQHQETDQVAAAVNEMAITVQEVARNAAEAALSTNEAKRNANEGQTIVHDTIASVDGLAGNIRQSEEVIFRLKSKCENIGSVLDVIRGIADQTNLLALNAAIEAARAGEHGRGFAVVADEVRTLANRTQQSTQEIQVMIEALQDEATEASEMMDMSRTSSATAVEQATRAEQALASIAQSVAKLNDMSTQIATAAEEQSTMAETINSSVVSIAQGSEGTEQMTNQTARAAEELNQLGEQLRVLVHKFNA